MARRAGLLPVYLHARLAAAKIPYTHEEFDGGHMNTAFRYDRSFELITGALARAD